MSNESNFSFTTKVNGDLFTVRGDNAKEFAMNTIAGIKLVEHVIALQQAITREQLEYANSKAGVTPVEEKTTRPATVGELRNVVAETGSANPWDIQEEDKVDPSVNPNSKCKHGVRNFREGVSKASGKPYSGWFCASANKDDECAPVFGGR